MNFLRAGLGSTHIFQFSKDDLVILPVVVLLLGSAIGTMWGMGILARTAALALVLGWIGWGLFSLSRDVEGRFRRPEYQEAKTTRLPPARLAS